MILVKKNYSALLLVFMAIMNKPKTKKTRPVYRFSFPGDPLAKKLSASNINETIVKNNPITKFSSFNLLYIKPGLKENDI
jgi:hypothetical protein